MGLRRKTANFLVVLAVIAVSIRACEELIEEGQKCDQAYVDCNRDVDRNYPPPLSECLEIRNAIGAVFAAHRSALPILAREGASRMLQMPAVKDVLRSERVFASLSHDAVAYGLLHAVTRAQYRHDADGAGGRAGAGPAARAPPLNQPIARRCGLSANDAEVVVDRLAALVPNDVSDASSDAGDDDLFA